MTSKKKTDLIDKNDKWAKESANISSSGAVRSTQIAFDFDLDLDTVLRQAAARRHITPSAIIREHLELTIAEPSRKRISLSFTDSELAELAIRYQLDHVDKVKIKNCIANDISTAFSVEDRSQSDLVSKKEELFKVQELLNCVKTEVQALQAAADKVTKTIDTACAKDMSKGH
jgi:hypothetical protein